MNTASRSRTHDTVLKLLWTALLYLSGAQASAGTVLIQEVLYDGPGGDADDVFTELFGTPGMVLDGWYLVGFNGSSDSLYRTIDLTGMVVPDDSLLVLATASAGVALVGVRDYVAAVDWQNGDPDAIQLLDPFGITVDALQYGLGFGAGVNRGEGTAAVDVTAGMSLSRDVFATDTDINAADFAAALPTPGIGPAYVAVPAPPTLTAFAIGVLMLGRFARS